MIKICHLIQAVRSRLQTDSQLFPLLQNRIYITLPQHPVYPYLLCHIDDVTYGPAACRIQFNLRLLAVEHIGLTPLTIGQRIDALLEQTPLVLENHQMAVCRKLKIKLDLPLQKTPCLLQQFYETMIWQEVV